MSGRRKNIIHFANVWFQLSLWEQILRRQGGDRKAGPGRLCCGHSSNTSLTPSLLFTVCLLPLFPMAQHWTCLPQSPFSQPSYRTATSFLGSSILVPDPVSRDLHVTPGLFHLSRLHHLRIRPTPLGLSLWKSYYPPEPSSLMEPLKCAKGKPPASRTSSGRIPGNQERESRW